MDIKYPIENEYMKYVLQINGFSGPRPWVRSNRQVGSGRVREGRDRSPRSYNLCKSIQNLYLG